MGGALREEEEFPPKLLDCPVFDSLAWPEEFVHVGDALRFDYASKLHSSDGSWEQFNHRMSTGIQAYLPADGAHAVELADAGAVAKGILRLRDPFEPVDIGFAQRAYLVGADGRQVILSNPGLGVDEVDMEESFRVLDLPPCAFAWDVEMLRIICISDDNVVQLVLAGGLLRLSDGAMIVG